MGVAEDVLHPQLQRQSPPVGQIRRQRQDNRIVLPFVGETDDFRTALDVMHEQYPGAPLWAGGMSFGAWVALTVGAEDPRVSLLIAIAPPVDRYDFEPIARSTKPKFFIHGERDELCPLKQMREFYARAAEPKELVVIDAADHLFDGKVSEVADAIEDLLGDWS